MVAIVIMVATVTVVVVVTVVKTGQDSRQDRYFVTGSFRNSCDVFLILPFNRLLQPL